VGDPFDTATIMGPVITAQACDRIVGLIDHAKQRGTGRLVAGGERIGGDLAGGFYVQPTVFADVDNTSDLAQHEVFVRCCRSSASATRRKR